MILDAGCGTGRDCVYFEHTGMKPIGLDLSTELLDVARAQTSAPLVQGDMRHLPLPSGSVDGVWACASLVHLDVPDTRQAVKEFARVTRPGGALYCSVKLGSEGDWTTDNASTARHFHAWSVSAFRHLVEHMGYRVTCAVDEAGESGGAWINLLAVKRP